MGRRRKIVCGIDEVGRGPLAGPVVSAAVVLPPGLNSQLLGTLKDSKQLTPARRAILAAEIRASCLVGFGAASAKEIDTLNILRATMLSMSRAVRALRIPVDHALVDGNQLPSLPCPASCIIRGDELKPAIAAASIVAKVLRDRLMVRLAGRYPGYGWEDNVGYGTRRHAEALGSLGFTPHHRRTFRLHASGAAADSHPAKPACQGSQDA